MKRPRGVTIIGVLLIVQGLFEALVIGLVLALRFAQFSGKLPTQLADAVQRLALADILLIVAEGVLAVGALISGVAMLLLRSWAWLIAMTLQGITMGIELFNFERGRPNYPVMVLAAIIVFYLNTHTIRHTFDVAQHRAATPALHQPVTGSALAGDKGKSVLTRKTRKATTSDTTKTA